MTIDTACQPPASNSRRTGAPTVASDLRVALTRIARRLRTQRGEVDLAEGQFGVLTTLHKHGAMSPGALADHENVRPPSMTRTVNTLAEHGLVTKLEHPTDKRQVVVELSEAGHAEVRETRRRRDQWLTKRLQELTPEERDTLAAATKLLTRIANA